VAETTSERKLSGQIALVTGAARRIGREIALSLSAEGARVVIHYGHSQTEAEAVVAEIQAAGGEAFSVQAELTHIADITRMFDEVQKRLGALDILVNNAAKFAPTPVGETTEQQWDQLLDSNVKAQFFCSQSAAPLLKRSGRGRIVNIASLGGLLAWSKYTGYCVSKAGVIMLTRCLARALAPEVTVNAIAPGTISFPDDAPELAELYVRQAPLKTTGNANDIAQAVLYFVHAPFVTGQVLAVDGGRSIPA
jgi:NAD(P)-dependent dehydrogenase (short-subunit alcohol dehydrogenase family)